MSFSNDTNQTTKTFEEKIAPENQGNILEKFLPLVSGGKFDEMDIVKILAGQNPQLQSLLPLMPLIKNLGAGTGQKPKHFDYIKIADYYKNK